MLQHGVPLIWVVDPESRDVSIYRPGQDTQLAAGDEMLTGEDVLEDFHCPVAELFQLPADVQSS